MISARCQLLGESRPSNSCASDPNYAQYPLENGRSTITIHMAASLDGFIAIIIR